MLRTAEHERPISFIILSSLVWCYPRLPSRLRMIAVTCLYHVCLCPDMSWEEKLFSGWLLYTGWSLNLQDPFRILRLRFRIDSESFSLKWLDSTWLDTTIERHRQTWPASLVLTCISFCPGRSKSTHFLHSSSWHTHTKTNNIYRYIQHTRRGRDVLYPFGYGLSYTMLGCRSWSGLCVPFLNENHLSGKRCNAPPVLQYCAGRLNPYSESHLSRIITII